MHWQITATLVASHARLSPSSAGRMHATLYGVYEHNSSAHSQWHVCDTQTHTWDSRPADNGFHSKQ